MLAMPVMMFEPAVVVPLKVGERGGPCGMLPFWLSAACQGHTLGLMMSSGSMTFTSVAAPSSAISRMLAGPFPLLVKAASTLSSTSTGLPS